MCTIGEGIVLIILYVETFNNVAHTKNKIDWIENSLVETFFIFCNYVISLYDDGEGRI